MCHLHDVCFARLVQIVQIDEIENLWLRCSGKTSNVGQPTFYGLKWKIVAFQVPFEQCIHVHVLGITVIQIKDLLSIELFVPPHKNVKISFKYLPSQCVVQSFRRAHGTLIHHCTEPKPNHLALEKKKLV